MGLQGLLYFFIYPSKFDLHILLSCKETPYSSASSASSFLLCDLGPPLLFTTMCVADVEDTKTFDGGSLVLAFYEALQKGKVEEISKLLVTHLSWRFYGPPSERHLARYLSGITNKVNFSFQVTSMHVINSTIICIEGESHFVQDTGSNSRHRRAWVHVWTLQGNKLAELREYFDAILTIVTLEPYACQQLCTLWQSNLSKDYERSFPSLVLII
ncbi:hypothetical protein GOP47_0026504 [Adiantum capillus-veneris]|nr:hypothetical protein GOP47_0026504 [Adiantum capillus-veneris]